MEKKMKQKYKMLFSDTVVFTISSFASKILVFLLIPLYTAVLSTKQYGIADLITNTVNVIYPILTLSIMEATLRFAFDENNKNTDVLNNSLFVIFVAEVVILIIWPFSSVFGRTMHDYWLWFAIIFGGFNLEEVLAQYTKGINKTRVFAIAGVIQTLVIIISNIIGLLVLKGGLTAYLLSIVLGYYLSSAYLIVAAKIRVEHFTLNWNLLKEMLEFSIPTIPVLISWWINTSADKYMIIAYQGIAESGIYSVAYKIPSILAMVTSIFTSAWTISAIKNVGEDDNDEYQTNIYQFFNIANILACSILILFSKVISSILFSESFFVAWHYVPILLVAYLFSGLAGFMASSFRAAKYTKGLFGSTVIGAIVNIAMNFYCIKRFGSMGAAFTTMVGFAVMFYIRRHSMQKIVKLRVNIVKDSLMYVLLLVQAIVISFEVPGSWFIAVGILIILVAINFKYIFRMLKTFFSMFELKKDRG